LNITHTDTVLDKKERIHRESVSSGKLYCFICLLSRRSFDLIASNSIISFYDCLDTLLQFGDENTRSLLGRIICLQIWFDISLAYYTICL